jgi:hypothetical protein
LPNGLHLRIHRSDLTYEVALVPFVAAVIDTPGMVAAALASALAPFNVSLADIKVDEGRLENRGLTCEIDELDANVVLRADRFEIHFSSVEPADTRSLIDGVWKALSSGANTVLAASHSLLFEIDCEFQTGTYGDVLGEFCRPPEGLPKGTETAVVYYIPPDKEDGLRDSNIVLNRSAEVEGGILVAATIVFDGSAPGQKDVIAAGVRRFHQFLKSLDITLGNR